MKSYGYKKSLGNIHHHIVMLCLPKSFYWLLRYFPIRKSVNILICQDTLSQSGEIDFLTSAWPDSRKGRGAGDPALFPPEIIVSVKALACQLPIRVFWIFDNGSSRRGQSSADYRKSWYLNAIQIWETAELEKITTGHKQLEMTTKNRIMK